MFNFGLACSENIVPVDSLLSWGNSGLFSKIKHSLFALYVAQPFAYDFTVTEKFLFRLVLINISADLYLA